MQYKKLTPSQRCTLAWQRWRNHLVCEILEKDKHISRALKMANKIAGSKRKKRKH